MYHLRDDFAKQLPAGDPFAVLQAIQGKVYREVKGRRTVQFTLSGKSYFVKNHSGVGWKEILKNILQLRLPILGAENEWRAIEKLGTLGVSTMTTVAYGSRGLNPARRESFIVTEDLNDTISLEDYCRPWRHSTPDFVHKQKLLHRVALISRKLHSGGVCHRDYYLCHFLMPKLADGEPLPAETDLFLIDLHRALIKTSLPQRWIVKDISGLLYSAMDVGLTRRDFLRFIKHYEGMSLKESLTKNADFWNSVLSRASAMRDKLGPVK